MTLKTWFWLLLLSVIWGGSFIFIELALLELTPLTIVACRTTLAAIVLLVAVSLSGRIRDLAWPHWPMFAVMGLLNNVVPFALIIWGQQSIEAGRASVLNGTMPLFTVILAHFYLSSERLTGTKISGVAIGFAGVVLLTGQSVVDSNTSNSLHGQLAVLLAAFSYAIASIYGKRLQVLSPIASAAGMLTMASVFSIPLVFLVEQPTLLQPQVSTLLAVLALGVICTALAYQLYFIVLAKAGPSNLSLVTFLIPLSANLMGVVFLNETLGISDLLGIGLILTGMSVATGLYAVMARLFFRKLA